MTAEMSGTRPQNFIRTEGRIVARVRAATGPSGISPAGRKGATPAHCPRAETGDRNSVHASAAWLRQRR